MPVLAENQADDNHTKTIEFSGMPLLIDHAPISVSESGLEVFES